MKGIKSHIINSGMAYDGQYFWMIEQNTNWLCRLSDKEEVCEYIIQIPNEKSKGLQTSHAVGIVNKEYIYCMPVRSTTLWKYHTINGQLTKINLPSQGNAFVYISNYWVVGEHLWMASCTGRIWKIALSNTDEIKWFDLVVSDGSAQLGSDFFMENDHIYGVSNKQGIIYDFDMISTTTYRYNVDETTNGFHTVCKREDWFYLTGKGGTVCEYNVRTQNKNEYNLYDHDVKVNQHMYIKSILYGENIALIPWLPDNGIPNHVVIYDIKTHKMSELKLGGEQNSFCLYCCVLEGTLYFDYMDRDVLYKYNFTSQELVKWQYDIVNQEKRDQHLFITGIINESVMARLQDYINAICGK